MKTPRILLLTLCAVLALTGCSGCAITKAFQYKVSASTSQEIIDNANKTIQVGDELAASFLQLENDHRATILRYTNEPRKYAHYLRDGIPDPTQIILPGDRNPPLRYVPRWTGYLKAARAAVVTFKSNRTPEGEANLNTAIKVIQDMIRECQAMTAKANQSTP